MSLCIYNSLTQKKEVLEASKKQTIKIYACGVTAYDRSHIGHARSLYVFDYITRYLRFRGHKVRFVRNITDIDDKIINKAKELNKDWRDVIKDNIDAYYKDMEALGIAPADSEPRATDNIAAMIKHIEGLVDKKYAYAVDGSVYYQVRKFKDYGKLSGQSIDQMMSGVRIEPGEKKKDPLDFALWKKSKEGEPSWDSPWGKGRPGWHIECSCMSMEHLKAETLDIHAGGRDLIFPHHENEIAQSEALTGKPFARLWIHHGLLTINGQKMAKSTGNFITITDVLKKYPADVLKLLYLQSHHASPIDFSLEKMDEAKKTLDRFDILFWKAFELVRVKDDIKPKSTDFIKQYKEEFLAAMDDDFNTPKALAALFHLLNSTNRFIDQEKRAKDFANVVYEAVNTLEDFAKNIFGLFSKEPQRELTGEEKDILEERRQVRLKKDFKRSDQLRDALKDKGIAVEDTKDGQVWRWL